MEEKKESNLGLKIVIAVLVIILLICVGVIVFLLIDKNKVEESKEDLNPVQGTEIESEHKKEEKNYKKVMIDGNEYYQKLNEDTWNGEYKNQKFDTANKVDSIMKVVSYKDYLEEIELVNEIISADDFGGMSSNEIKAEYSDRNSNYIILSYANGMGWCKMKLIDCIEEDDKIIIYGDEQTNGVMASGSGYFIAIPTDMPAGTEIEYIECYSEEEIENLKKYQLPYEPFSAMLDKPVIYLYPTEEQEISVELLKPENLTCSYPKYQDKWNVLAKPNGDLRDLNTNRELYSLYYESESETDFKVEKEGFVVKGEDVIEFLEEKLAILGLTEREAEEFIIYWLPRLEANEYNYIRFASLDEINENMPLEIKPNPDTVIRVLMTFKGLENPIEVEEQKLETPERTGFVAVEWGGSEIW